MPRPSARRPAPIVLPNHPMDTLWEVDESSDDLTPTRPSTYASSRSRASSSSWSMASPPRDQLRSIFEDDDDEEDLRNVAFPLPPVTLPHPVKRLFSVPRMTLPIHPAPRTVSAPSSPSRRVVSAPPRKSSLSPKHPSLAPRSASIPFPRERSVSPQSQPRLSPVTPPRRRADVQRPVSPTSSASSSDNELPRTPPATTTSLPIPAPVSKPYVLAPPPPAEWESAIDALFADYYDDDEDVISVPPSPVSSAPPMPTRRPPPPPRSHDSSYLSFSPVSDSSVPLSPSMLPMSPTFARALGSPGFMPTSPGNSDSEHTFFSSSFVAPRSISVPSRPARRRDVRIMPERTTIPVEFLFQTA